MKALIRAKAKGLAPELARFYDTVGRFTVDAAHVGAFTDLVASEMKALSFDRIAKDKAGNLVGVIKGHGARTAIVMISHIDTRSANSQRLEGFGGNGMAGFKSGVIAGVYAGALIRRSGLPLSGDLIVCCVPRVESCDFGSRYLFENHLKARSGKVKGVILCEPTGFNINLGHKGRMEYEIVVKGKLNRNFVENRGMNMLGTMFPLINELEKVSKDLPSDLHLGRSGLRVKDVRYSGYQPQNDVSEFRVVVDRVYIPEESEGFILHKAKTIAKTVYKQEPDVAVSALLAKERVKTYTGLDLISEKEFKPWAMESHAPFALESLETLKENGFRSGFGYWQKIVTEGSYTYGQLKIPTIGFGAGQEDPADAERSAPSADAVARAVYGHASIVLRSIGIPTFGWSSDEI